MISPEQSSGGQRPRPLRWKPYHVLVRLSVGPSQSSGPLSVLPVLGGVAQGGADFKPIGMDGGCFVLLSFLSSLPLGAEGSRTCVLVTHFTAQEIYFLWFHVYQPFFFVGQCLTQSPSRLFL